MTVEQLWSAFDDWYTDTEIHLYLVGIHYQTSYNNYGTFIVQNFSYNCNENTITIYV
jgi:predicted phosphoadenosine phosphosulfate sulfurtransferase